MQILDPPVAPHSQQSASRSVTFLHSFAFSVPLMPPSVRRGTTITYDN